jgi:hypothetical protein
MGLSCPPVRVTSSKRTPVSKGVKPRLRGVRRREGAVIWRTTYSAMANATPATVPPAAMPTPTGRASFSGRNISPSDRLDWCSDW